MNYLESFRQNGSIVDREYDLPLRISKTFVDSMIVFEEKARKK